MIRTADSDAAMGEHWRAPGPWGCFKSRFEVTLAARGALEVPCSVQPGPISGFVLRRRGSSLRALGAGSAAESALPYY
jgi:hypothetical protein